MDNLAPAGEKQRRKRGQQKTRLGSADPHWSEKVRAKITNSQITNQLIRHVKGEIELSAEQVSAARTLLAKVLPDLQAVENTTINELEGLNPDEIKQQVGSSLAANPQGLIDILRVDPSARLAVMQAIHVYEAELTLAALTVELSNKPVVQRSHTEIGQGSGSSESVH